MPMYQWHCPKCKTSVDVIRTFDESDLPPGELDVSHMACDHEWEKQIAAPTVVRGHSWGGGKGNW